MIFYNTKNCPVIEVDFNKFMDKIFKSSNYDSRKNFKRILESKWKYGVLVESPLYGKDSLVSVLLFNCYMMVSQESISERIHVFPSLIILYLI